MAAIDIGPGATDRDNDHSSGYTTVCLDNPANNGPGTIVSMEIWPTIEASGKFGTMYGTAPDFTPRDYETINNIPAGSKQIYNGLNCDVESGDYMAAYLSSGAVEMSTSGAGGIWRDSGDQWGGGEHTYPDNYATFALSIYGIGATTGVSHFGCIV